MNKDINIIYEKVDDWHIFTSNDIFGLYVASKDIQLAFNDLKATIEKLLLLNENIKFIVSSELSYEKFVEKNIQNIVYNCCKV